MESDDTTWSTRGGTESTTQSPVDPPSPWAPYHGPPVMTPPPEGWRPERVVESAPPRTLPPQDHVRLDAAEAAARTLTYGLGTVAGAILLVVLCALAARALF